LDEEISQKRVGHSGKRVNPACWRNTGCRPHTAPLPPARVCEVRLGSRHEEMPLAG